MNLFGCTGISTKPLLDQHSHETESPITGDLKQYPERQEQTEYNDDDDDDNADALSLCDLPIYSTSSSVSSSKNNGASYRGEYQEEANSFFEFFSFCGGELSSSSKSDDEANKDTIIFCGKLLVSKDEASGDHPLEQSNSDRVKDKTSKPNKRALFSWRRFKTTSVRKSTSQSKMTTSDSVLSSKALSPSSSFSSSSSKKEKNEISSAKKVSLLTSPTKSRWYMFMFGHTSFPQAMTMNLSDMKNRQRKQCSPSPSIDLPLSNGGVVVGKVAGGSGSDTGKGLWTLLTESATTVGKTNANDVVRAVGCVSLL